MADCEFLYNTVLKGVGSTAVTMMNKNKYYQIPIFNDEQTGSIT